MCCHAGERPSGRVRAHPHELGAHDYVILLDEIGDELDSPGFARLVDTAFTNARPVVLVIGGAYGVDDRIRQRADAVWSLSPLVFPHQLVRLILIEQLYPAQQITAGYPYHHS